MEGFDMSDGANCAISRRGFLNAGLAVAGGVFALGLQRAVGAAGKERARWVFLSDTHVAADPENNYRGFYPYRNLGRAVEGIVGDRPEGVVVTGDLARLSGHIGDYENLHERLSPVLEKCPTCLAMGNHDDRDNFRKVFVDRAGSDQKVRGKHVVAVDTGPVRLLVLDSLLFVNHVPGLLGKAQREWLASYLRTHDDKPVILFLHHTLGDGDGDLLDVPRLFEIIRPAAVVKAVVYGHSHAYAYSELDGIHLINLPALGYNFHDSQPLGWVEALLRPDGAEFILHAIAGNKALHGRSDKLHWRA